MRASAFSTKNIYEDDFKITNAAFRFPNRESEKIRVERSADIRHHVHQALSAKACTHTRYKERRKAPADAIISTNETMFEWSDGNRYKNPYTKKTSP
jgi:hypothetical protein